MKRLPFVFCAVAVAMVLSLPVHTQQQATVAPSDPPQSSQGRDELRPLCTQEEATDRSEEAFLRAGRDRALGILPTSDEGFWRLLTDPATPYMDRMLAARYGSEVVGLDGLMRIWKAAAAFDHLPIGVFPSPCEFLSSSFLLPDWWSTRQQSQRLAAGRTVMRAETRGILGRDVPLPMTAVDYPVTSQQRERSPWLWQMQRALRALTSSLEERYRQPARYPAMAAIAWSWQPADPYEAAQRARVLVAAPRNADMVSTIIRFSLDDQNQRYSSTGHNAILDLYVCCDDDNHLAWLVHVAQIVILQQTADAHIAANAAYQAVRSATLKPHSGARFGPVRSATGMLALSRWALDSRLEPSMRYFYFAGAIAEMAGNPPYRRNQAFVGSTAATSAHSTEIAEALASFDRWWPTQLEQLQREAAAESQRLNELAAEVGRSIETFRN